MYVCLFCNPHPCWCLQVKRGVDWMSVGFCDRKRIFRATMSLKSFHVLSRIIRFDYRESRAIRGQKQSALCGTSGWTSFTHLYDTGQCVTIEKWFVGFRSCCTYRQYTAAEPARYGFKIWAACHLCIILYVELVHFYSEGEAAGRNQGTQVVLDQHRTCVVTSVGQNTLKR